jgi:hypothetical protein
MRSDVSSTLVSYPSSERRVVSDPNPKQSEHSRQYDRLLKGEITSKDYVKTLKQAQSGRYSSRTSTGQKATSGRKAAAT